jgi:hypothetical protein
MPIDKYQQFVLFRRQHGCLPAALDTKIQKEQSANMEMF